jgi:hypothetical protein
MSLHANARGQRDRSGMSSRPIEVASTADRPQRVGLWSSGGVQHLPASLDKVSSDASSRSIEKDGRRWKI